MTEPLFRTITTWAPYMVFGRDRMRGRPERQIQYFMKTFSDEELQRAVDKCCTCGGYAKGERLACPACNVWHELKPELTFSAPTDAPEPANDAWANKTPKERLSDLVGSVEAARIFKEPEPAKPEASGDRLARPTHLTIAEFEGYVAGHPDISFWAAYQFGITTGHASSGDRIAGLGSDIVSASQKLEAQAKRIKELEQQIGIYEDDFVRLNGYADMHMKAKARADAAELEVIELERLNELLSGQHQLQLGEGHRQSELRKAAEAKVDVIMKSLEAKSERFAGLEAELSEANKKIDIAKGLVRTNYDKANAYMELHRRSDECLSDLTALLATARDLIARNLVSVFNQPRDAAYEAAAQPEAKPQLDPITEVQQLIQRPHVQAKPVADWMETVAHAIARWAYGYYNGNDCGSHNSLVYWDGVGHELPGPRFTVAVVRDIIARHAPQPSQEVTAREKLAEGK